MAAERIFQVLIIAGFSFGIVIRLIRQTTPYQQFATPTKVFKALHRFYYGSFYYYSFLNKDEQKRFIGRAYRLSKLLNIKGGGGFEVTQPTRFLIAAAQVQLTFGYRRFYLSRFRNILVYPEEYKNKKTGHYHQGEVNGRGIIVLSWNNFLKGYKDPHDRINLGLHEMAHALMLTIIHTNDHEAGLDHYLNKVLKLSLPEIKRIKQQKAHLFRSYAGSNTFEFFAIAIENFFEDPSRMRDELPAIYHHLCTLLKQDPANYKYSM